MAFGLGILKLPPAGFWAMTPRELTSAYAGMFGENSAPCDSARLADLMQQFPD
jgi:uncharacterized phage protein (TIGR02216 family)